MMFDLTVFEAAESLPCPRRQPEPDPEEKAQLRQPYRVL
jgi:hypothetical protein